MRVKITLACSECKQRNYDSMKNKKNNPDRMEMNKKVTWPNRKELIQHTEVVITSIILVGAVLWVVDFAFAKVLNLLIK